MTTTEATWDRVYHTTDKSEWGDGPWQHEPDKVQWVDGPTGLDCLAVRNRVGAWCGYVGVPPEHPWFGRDYNDESLPDARVHCGLTYSAFCQENAPEAESICHVPSEGRPARVFWFGFDCGHALDYVPGFDAKLRDFPELVRFTRRQTYRTLAYVQAECAALAAQLHETREAS